MVGLVPIEKDVIPMVLLVNMHLIKGTLIIFPCDLAGYRAIPMVHWYQWYDWYQWKSTLFQWFYWWICISLRGLRLFSHVTWLGTGQFRWSIGTNGSIGSSRNDVIPMVLLLNKARWKYKHAMCILRSISHLCKTSSLLHQVKTRYIYTNRYDSSNRWSIGTNGRIGTNRKGCHSNGSVT